MIRRLLTALVLLFVYPLIGYVQVARADPRRHSKRFRFCAEFLSLVPFEIGILVRRLYYERTLARCGSGLMVFFGATFLNPDATIGDGVEIRPHSIVGLVDLGDHVSLAQRVSILSGRHQHSGLSDAGEQLRLPPQKVRIGAGAWIGAHAVVMANVGQATVVGAGAVVVQPLPPHALAVGVPARVVKQDPPPGDGLA
jgi:acetyltransferase-like isoleucine patch superfamily enzyme